MAALLQVISNSELLARENEQIQRQLAAEQQQPGVLGLAGYVRSCFEESKRAKDQTITPRLLDCMRRRKGEYDPLKLQEIRQTMGGSEIYMLLTDIKCRSAEAWIKDILMPAGDRPWTLEPTPIPEINPALAQQVTMIVQMEMEQALAMGMPVHPATFLTRAEQLYDQAMQRIKVIAQQAAERMAATIEDDMVEGGWRQAFSEFITDFVTFPTAFLKGPVARPKRVLAWGQNWLPRAETKTVFTWERLSPFDIYPAPGISSLAQGYVTERRLFTRRSLSMMRDMEGYSSAAISQVLLQYGSSGLRNWLMGDTERARLEDKPTTLFVSPVDAIEGLEYAGPVSGLMLQEWGLRNVDRYAEYEASVIVIGPYVIRAMINPDVLDRRSYQAASFEMVPGSLWGRAIPEQMADIQDQCNSAARALMNNLSMASGPLVEVYVDRLPEGEKVTKLYPWKIHQTTSDRSGANNPAVHFYQPQAHIVELQGLIEAWERKADERTAIPNYTYGSTDVSGAGRTMGGLSMLMGAAAKGIKLAIANADLYVVEPTVESRYYHHMLHNPDRSLKGDLKPKARGAAALVIKEVLGQRRIEFLNATNNPTDMAIIGPDRRAAVLREVAKSLDMPPDDTVPSRDEIRQRMTSMAAAQAQAQAEMGPASPTTQPVGL